MGFLADFLAGIVEDAIWYAEHMQQSAAQPVETAIDIPTTHVDSRVWDAIETEIRMD